MAALPPAPKAANTVDDGPPMVEIRTAGPSRPFSFPLSTGKLFSVRPGEVHRVPADNDIPHPGYGGLSPKQMLVELRAHPAVQMRAVLIDEPKG